jgi:diacylglycerol O-acyltransferase / wax synthase
LAILHSSTRPTGALAAADIQALIARAVDAVAVRLEEVPLSLDYPYWVDDRDFDLDFHVRERAVAAPASDVQLCEQVARIVARSVGSLAAALGAVPDLPGWLRGTRQC